MKCDICPTERMARSIYCPACYDLVEQKPEGRARVASLKRARREDGFHCEYCGALLNLSDPSDPLFIHFDHPIPGLRDWVVATGAIINQSKTNLTYLEYPYVVHEAVNHWDTGDPFRKDAVPFSKWAAGRRIVRPTSARLVDQALGPRLLDAGLLRPAGMGKACLVCRRYAAADNGRYCWRCRPLVWRNTGDSWQVKVGALRNAYRAELDNFVDYHLGVRLDLFDWSSPFYPNFDHLIPGMKGNLVLTSTLANEMKTDTDVPEWHAYFRMLDAAFQGGAFERGKLEFKYWKRTNELKVRKVA